MYCMLLYIIKLILVFRKDPLNQSKVTVKIIYNVAKEYRNGV